MEAARIAAERGHSVTIYEQKGSVGGLLDFAHAVKGDHENLGALRNYLSGQLELQGVEVVTGQEVDLAFIQAQSPEVVILATGGLRDSLGFGSTSGTQVVRIEDFMTTELGDNIVIVGSNAQAIDSSMYLLAEGKNVTIVTASPSVMVGDGHSNWVRTFTLPMIKALGTRIFPETKLSSVNDGAVTVTTAAGIEMVIPCDSVIEAMDMLPNTDILAGLAIESYAVGDCDNPYNIANAIATGNLIARKI
jgi:pyruvate/2-oxoglutarate dehydrogenase complex dihydrolipoamide dehydrogenase (E3) component